MAPARAILLVALSAFAAAAAVAPPAPVPPCYNPLNSAYETLCYTTTASSGNITIRDMGVGIDGALMTGMSAFTGFANGSLASAVPLFEYFLSDNDEFRNVPFTVPLIFRPDPAGTWLASFALPTSVFPQPSEAPGIIPGSDLIQEAFAPSGTGRTIAAYMFYTIELATEDDYAAACASLTAALPGMGFTPVPGDEWAVAWVTYSTQAIVGDRINECWMEVTSNAA